MNKLTIQAVSIIIILWSIPQFVFAQHDWQNSCGTIQPSTVSELPLLHRDALVNGDSVIIIPTVFHILTQGGSENISKSHVQRALQILNQDFNRQNPDTFDIPAPFHPLRGNPKVEFRLARIDPQGNCTDGINRVYTPLSGTFGNYLAMQPTFSWDHTRYMNIYVANWLDYNNTCVNTGLSYIAPPESGQQWGTDRDDALAIGYFSIAEGFNGVPGQQRGHLLTHEMGHNLGLLHIWILPGCADDDLVADTPLQNDQSSGCPHFPHLSCNSGPNGDMFTNYMDYSDCINMFSEGQADRMRRCLDRNDWRKTLWTPANLAATGVDSLYPACPNSPIADFGYGNFAGWHCAGKPVQFYEASGWRPTSYQWEFAGGIPAISTDTFPSVVFPDTGMHSIKLVVSNGFGSDTIVKMIRIEPAEVKYSLIDDAMTESFENAAFNAQIVPFTIKGKKWSITNLAAYSGTQSIHLDNNLRYLSTFFTHAYDLSQMEGTGRVLEFKVALGVSSGGTAIQGGLRVTWKRPYAYERNELFGDPATGTSAALHPGDGLLPSLLQTVTTDQVFIPMDSTQWKTITLDIPDSLSGEIQIGFDWGCFAATTKFKGLYIDDIKLISLPVGIAETTSGMGWRLFPNPANKHLTIAFADSNKKVYATITDITGKIMYKTTETEAQNIEVSTQDFAEGVYVVQIQTPDGIELQKFIVAR